MHVLLYYYNCQRAWDSLIQSAHASAACSFAALPCILENLLISAIAQNLQTLCCRCHKPNKSVIPHVAHAHLRNRPLMAALLLCAYFTANICFHTRKTLQSMTVCYSRQMQMLFRAHAGVCAGRAAFS
jgi:hypothetical protein